jgi:hypothetical protein
MTSAQPSAAQAQKPNDGRCRSHTAATTAVASGSSPVTTAACAASTWRTAKPRNSGNPNTAPMALPSSGQRLRRCGNGARVHSR